MAKLIKADRAFINSFDQTARASTESSPLKFDYIRDKIQPPNLKAAPQATGRFKPFTIGAFSTAVSFCLVLIIFIVPLMIKKASSGQTLALLLNQTGDVQIGNQNSTMASGSSILKQNIRVKTGKNGQAELQLAGKGMMTILPESRLKITTLEVTKGQGNIKLALAAGSIAVKPAKLTEGENFLIQTPNALVSVKGTRFTVTITDQNTTRVSVAEGAVEITPLGEKNIPSSEPLRIIPGESCSVMTYSNQIPVSEKSLLNQKEMDTIISYTDRHIISYTNGNTYLTNQMSTQQTDELTQINTSTPVNSDSRLAWINNHILIQNGNQAYLIEVDGSNTVRIPFANLSGRLSDSAAIKHSMFFISDQGTLLGYSVTGSLLVHKENLGSISYLVNPTIINNQIIVANIDHSIHVLDTKGTLITKTDLNSTETVYQSPQALNRTAFIYGTDEGRIVAYSIELKHELWSTSLSSESIYYPFAVHESAVIVLQRTSGQVSALNPKTGDIIWTKAASKFQKTPFAPFVTGDTLVLCSKNSIKILNIKTGETLQTIEIPEEISALGHDNQTLIIGGINGLVKVFQPGQNVPVWSGQIQGTCRQIELKENKVLIRTDQKISILNLNKKI